MKSQLYLFYKVIIFYLMFYQSSYTNAQQYSNDLPNGVPDVKFKTLISDSLLETSFSKIGKPLILDFSTTNCKPCIKLLPKLDSLRKKFSGNLEVVMVTFEKKASVDLMLQRLKNNGVRINIPIIYEDTLLYRLFQPYTIPHEVWVNANGELYAVTDHEYISEENIFNFIKNVPVKWSIKKESLLDSNQSLVQQSSSLTHKGTSYYSTLTGRLIGYRNSINHIKDTLKNTVRSTYVNYSILSLYMKAWNRLYYYKLAPNQVILDIKDTGKIMFDSKYKFRREWEEENTYCYESVMPISSSEEEQQEKFRSDLNYYFNLNGRLENRIVDCWVITRKDDRYKKFVGKKNGMTLNTFIYQMNRSGFDRIVLNETRLTLRESQDIRLPISGIKNNLEILKKELNCFGFDITIQKRSVEFFVMSELNSKDFSLKN